MTTPQNKSVAVAGASGFVGHHIVAALLSRGYTVHALVRDKTKAAQVLPKSANLKLFTGTLDEPTALNNLVAGCSAVVNAVGIIREIGTQTFDRIHRLGTANLIAAATGAKINRFIQISALGVGDDGISEYQTSKYEAETLVRRSGMTWTILRPSFIMGEGSSGIESLTDLMTGDTAPWIFIPYFQRIECDDTIPLGPANAIDPMIQPVEATDVAAAVCESLVRPQAEGEIFNLVGKDRMTWPQLLTFLRDNTPGTKKSLKPFPIPAPVGAAVADLAKLIGAGAALPFDSGMAKAAAQDSVSETNKVAELLGIQPQSFTASYKQYAAAP